jgi:hypothetical protein
MYHGGVLGASAGTLAGAGAGAAGVLPFTGLELIWAPIAAFALMMAAGALWRIVPRSHA